MNFEKRTIKFLVYPIEIVQFIEFCERFQVIRDVDIRFVVEEKMIDDSITYNKLFICDVTFHSETDAIKFQNIFTLFFKVSKHVPFYQERKNERSLEI